MGCASSKQSGRRCRHCKAAAYSPPVTRRSFSLHHPGDSYHCVALTSTTVGSLNLEEEEEENDDDMDDDGINGFKLAPPEEAAADYQIPYRHFDYKKEFEIGVIEDAKAWSKMIDEKIRPPKAIPKTPVMTPPGEPETINAWELMEGLEEDNKPTTCTLLPPAHQLHSSFSSHYYSNCNNDNNDNTIISHDHDHHLILDDSPKPTTAAPPFINNNTHDNHNKDAIDHNNSPLWIDTHITSTPPDYKEDGDDFITRTIVSDFDPQVISAFRKALEQLSPSNPFHLDKQQKSENHPSSNAADDHTTTDSDYDTIRNNHEDDNMMHSSRNQSSHKAVVLYLTSLRGIRKTYEDCCNVRVILKGLGVKVDERDVSMHSGFKEELRELLLASSTTRDHGMGGQGGLILPRLFLGDEYIGGAEEVKRMHEEGQLEKVLRCCDKVDEDGVSSSVCEACGDIRFVPCETCSGSCKIYLEAKEDQEDVCKEEEQEEEEEEHKHGFQRCPDCNENGLVRCPVCCS